MKYHFLILINLAAIISIGKFSPVFDPHNNKQLDPNCILQITKLSEKLERFLISENNTVQHSQDAFPYVDLILLDSVIECCKVPGRFVNIDQRNITQSNKTICPMNYLSTYKNLRIDLTNGVQYLNNKTICDIVCGFSIDSSTSCRSILFVNELIRESSKKGLTLAKEKEKPSQTSNEKAVNSHVSEDFTAINDEDIKVASAIATGNIVLPEKKPETISSVTEKPNNVKAVEDGATKSKYEKPVNGKDGVKINNKNYGTDNIPVPETKDFIISDKEGTENKSPRLPIVENTDLPESELPSMPDQQLLRTKSDYKNNNNYKKGYGDGPHLKTSGSEGEDDENNAEVLGKPGAQNALSDKEPEFGKNVNTKEIYNGDNFFQAEDSHFSAYFLMTISIIIIGYVVYHNKNKIVAYALEGRRSKSGRRRPTSASYRKLDSNLEEAITSNPSNASVTNVVY